jgi:hypothetical protein
MRDKMIKHYSFEGSNRADAATMLELISEAKTYAERMSAKLMEYKKATAWQPISVAEHLYGHTSPHEIIVYCKDGSQEIVHYGYTEVGGVVWFNNDVYIRDATHFRELSAPPA